MIGYTLFLKRVNLKRKLDTLQKEADTKLNSINQELSVDEYLEIKKKIRLAGRDKYKSV
jgi:hypothetical protein